MSERELNINSGFFSRKGDIGDMHACIDFCFANKYNCIGGGMVGVLVLSEVKPKTITLVFVASPITKQH